jgi:hypothetical protein
MSSTGGRPRDWYGGVKGWRERMAAGGLRERGVFQTGSDRGIAGKTVPVRRRHRGPAAGELSALAGITMQFGFSPS